MKFTCDTCPQALSNIIRNEKDINLYKIIEDLQQSYDLGDKQGARTANYNLATFEQEYVIQSNSLISCINSLFMWIFHSPQRDMNLQHMLLPTLISLVKKIPSDVEKSQISKIIQWRSIYREIRNVTEFFPNEHVNPKIKGQLIALLQILIKHTRNYFTPSEEFENIIDELLQEFVPKLCPHDHINLLTNQTLLAWFFPSIEISHLESVKKLIQIIDQTWHWIEDNEVWNFNWFSILLRIAESLQKMNNLPISITDLWSKEYLENIFTRVLNLLDVAVATNQKLSSLKKSTPITSLLNFTLKRSTSVFSKFSKFIVYTIDSQTCSISLLLRLFELIRSYYHPSNGGSWNTKLATILSKTSLNIEKRLSYEKRNEIQRISEIDLQPLIDTLVNLSLQAIRSKDNTMKEAGAKSLVSLIWIHPEQSIHVIESIQELLISSTSPVQLISSINVLSKICFIILPNNSSSFEEIYSSNMKSLLNFLHQTLPGIDSNDFFKTETTLSFYNSFAKMASYDILQTNEYQELFNDWSLLFFKRILEFLLNLQKEDVKSVRYRITTTLHDLIPLWNDDQYDKFIDLFFNFINSNISTISYSVYASIIRIFHQTSSNSQNLCEKTLAHFVKILDVKNNEFSNLLSNDYLKWNLGILIGAIDGFNAEFIVSNKETLFSFIYSGFHHSSKEIFSCSLHILNVIFHRLSFFYQLPICKKSNYSDKIISKDSMKISWYEPGDHVHVAYEILDNLLSTCKNEIHTLFNLEKQTTETNTNEEQTTKLFIHLDITERQKLERNLKLLSNILSHGGMLLRNSEEHTSEIQIENPGFNLRKIQRLYIGDFFKQSNYSRRELIGSLLLLCGDQITSNDNNSMNLFSSHVIQVLSKIIKHFLSDSVSCLSYHKKYFSYKKDKQNFTIRLHPKAISSKCNLYPISTLHDRIWIQLQRRVSLQNQYLNYTPLHKKLIHLQYILSQNEYIDVRRIAQRSFSSSCIHFITSRDYFINQIFTFFNSLLSNNDIISSNDKIDSLLSNLKGNLYLLLSSSIMSIIRENWNQQSRFLQIILQISTIFERPSIQKLIYMICTSYITLQFYSLPIVTGMPEKSISSSSLDSTVLLHAKKQHEINTNENQQAFNEITNTLIEISPTPINWRYEILRLTILFTLHCRNDIPLHPKIIQIFLKNLSSDIKIIRKFSCSAISSLLGLHSPTKHTEIYSNWNISMKELNVMKLQIQSHETSKEENNYLINTEMRDIFLDIWKNEKWLDGCINFFVEDHHIKTEEEEADKQPFDLSLISQIASQFLGSAIQFDISIQPSSGSIPSDVLQTLSTSIEQKIRWPLSNFHEDNVSYLFNIKNANLFYEIFSSIFYPLLKEEKEEKKLQEIFDHFLQKIKELASSNERKHQVTVAEIISGTQKALLTNNNEENYFFTYFFKNSFFDIWKNVFNGEIGFSLDWPTAIRFSLTGLTPSKYLPHFLPILYSANVFNENSRKQDDKNSFLPLLKHNSNEISSNKLVRSLACIRSMFIEGNWRFNEISLNEEENLSFLLISSILSHGSYPSSVVRVELAQIISILIQNNIKLDKNVKSSNFFSLKKLIPFYNEQKNEKNLLINEKEVSLQRETVLLFLTNLFSKSIGSELLGEIIDDILFTVFHSLKDDSNYVQQLARSCLALIAQARYSLPTAIHFIDSLEKNIYSSSDWHLRRAILPVIQIFDFNHRFLLNDDLHKKIHEICIKLLMDSQIEVRELASISLSSVLRGWNEDYIIELSNRFLKASNMNISSSSSSDSSSSKNEKRFLVRHGGVLGLCALVRMFPYDLPSFIVPVIMKLVEHNEDPTVISSSVRNTMKEFWRTHQEMWHVYKANVLTLEQATILQDILISPSYYA